MFRLGTKISQSALITLAFCALIPSLSLPVQASFEVCTKLSKYPSLASEFNGPVVLFDNHSLDGTSWLLVAAAEIRTNQALSKNPKCDGLGVLKVFDLERYERIGANKLVLEFNTEERVKPNGDRYLKTFGNLKSLYDPYSVSSTSREVKFVQKYIEVPQLQLKEDNLIGLQCKYSSNLTAMLCLSSEMIKSGGKTFPKKSYLVFAKER